MTIESTTTTTTTDRWLCDSETTNRIRLATAEEARESDAAGDEGHIYVDGRRCYVEV